MIFLFFPGFSVYFPEFLLKKVAKTDKNTKVSMTCLYHRFIDFRIKPIFSIIFYQFYLSVCYHFINFISLSFHHFFFQKSPLLLVW